MLNTSTYTLELVLYANNVGNHYRAGYIESGCNLVFGISGYSNGHGDLLVSIDALWCIMHIQYL